MKSPSKKGSTLSHLPALDGVRGAGSFVVLFRHAMVFLDLKPQRPIEIALFSAMLKLSAGAMDIFFVLSAFLVSTILLRTRGATGYFRNFYARRILRIVPAYYVLLCLLMLVVPLLSAARAAELQTPHHPFYFFGYLVNIFIFQRNAPLGPFENHLWTLSLEEQIYILWPFLIFAAAPRVIYGLTIASLPLCAALRYVASAGHFDAMVTRSFTPLRLDSFLLGTTLALLQNEKKRPDQRNAKIYRAATLAGAVIGVSGFCFGDRATFEPRFANSATSLLTFGAIGLMLSDTGLPRLKRFLEQRWLQAIGRCSYSTYLLHQPFFVYLGPLMAAWLMRFGHSVLLTWAVLLPVLSAVALSVGAIGYHGLELYFLNLKRYFPYRRSENG